LLSARSFLISSVAINIEVLRLHASFLLAPLHQDKVSHLGVRAQESGPRIPVLDSQAERGFAFVPEAVCQELLLSKDKTVPSISADEDWKTKLALACIAAIKPEMSAQQASKKINQAYLLENPDCYGTLFVDQDLVSDCLDKREAGKMAQYALGVEKACVQKEVVMQTRDKYVGKRFKSEPKPRYTKAQKETPRWLPDQDRQTTAEILAWILKHAGPDVSVQKDDYNGRWRVLAPTLEFKSISWTKRGHQKAALEAIHSSWKFQSDWNGLSAPFNREDLAG
jgi:hypothetical protein